MKAAQLFGVRDLRIIDTEKPSPDHHSVVVKVACCVLCGSDVHQWDGRHPPSTYPAGFGHETAGTVVEVGSEVRGLSVGDRVTWYLSHGSLAEYFAFAPPEMAVGKLAGHITWEEGATIQLLCAVLRGVVNGKPGPGKRALVLGCGAVGLSVVQCARAMGVGEVVAADLIPFRRDLARRLGASYSADPGDEGWYNTLWRAGERFHIVYDCMDEDRSPGGDTLDLALRLMHDRGRCVIVGISSEPRTIHTHTILSHGLKIIGAHHREMARVRELMAMACQWVADGTIRVKPYVTHRFPLEEAQKAVETAASQADGVLKVAVDLE